MYRHLLVPIDDSELSTETVRQAVLFARSIGAKVTFFHAKSDYGASSDGALERVMPDPAKAFVGFAAAVDRYAAAEWPHMTLETKVIIPAAQKYLTDEDWSEIAEAFAANGDPRFTFDVGEEYRHLFARILNLAPEPVVGGANRAGR